MLIDSHNLTNEYDHIDKGGAWHDLLAHLDALGAPQSDSESDSDYDQSLLSDGNSETPSL